MIWEGFWINNFNLYVCILFEILIRNVEIYTGILLLVSLSLSSRFWSV